MIHYALILFLLASTVLYFRFTLQNNPMIKIPASLYRGLQLSERITYIELLALLLTTGFLAAYLYTLFPMTTHYAGVLSNTLLGGVNPFSFFSLIITNIILTTLTIRLFGKLQPLPFYILIILVLFAGIFLTIPSMAENSLSFMLLMPVAATSLLFALFMFNQISFSKPVNAGWKMFGGYVITMLGSLGASLLSLLFLIFLANGIVIIRPSVVVPAVVILTFFLFILQWRNLIKIFSPGHKFVDPLDTSDMANRCKMLGDLYGLTPREREVLVHFSEGRDMPYIEKKLMISRSTAKTHTAHIYQKVGVASRQELLNLLRSQPNDTEEE
jgi:DNA-binding CsgD family transcriptional regulator